MTDKETKNNTEIKENSTEFALKSPHISEKASLLAESGVYTFKVRKDANKIEIKNEVEKKYKVNVTNVGIIKIPSKKIRVGRRQGTKKEYKKAMVQIKKGQSIDLTSA